MKYLLIMTILFTAGCTYKASPKKSVKPVYQESELVRYENDEVVCYRARYNEGLACKWKVLNEK